MYTKQREICRKQREIFLEIQFFTIIN